MTSPGGLADPVRPGADDDGLAAGIADVVRLLRSSRTWTAHMDEILAGLGRRLRVSRVYLFQIHELPGAGLGQTCLFDWAAPGLAPLATDPRNIDEAVSPDPVFADWTERRRRGEAIMGHTRDLTGYLRADFEHQRILSFLSIPIMVNDAWWGHIGFDDCEREREWTAGERSVLQSVAYLIGSAIELSGSSLMMSEASRLAMLRSALDAIVVIDEESCVLEFNPAAEVLFGYRRDDILGRPLVDAIVPPEMRKAHATGFRRYLAGGESRLLGRRVEMEAVTRAGGRIPIELTVTEIRPNQRRLFVAYVRDLTERKAAEAEAARQRNALHQSEKMSALGSLLAGIAHELNNPLSVVVGRAVMLEEDCADDRQRDQLRRLREAAERCSRIAQTFLKMARHNPVSRRAVALDEPIRAALDMVAYAARSSGVTVALELDPGLPAVDADPDQIVQVVVNLAVNAVQAMGSGHGPRLLTVRTASGPEPGEASVLVLDTGPGIPDEVMPRIFEPFFTTKAVGAGTGVGLAVSHAMVSAHGGSLTAGNRPEGGAWFRMTLPAAAPGALAAGSAAPARPAAPGGRAVLVVDDEPAVADLLRDILERAGHRVTLAENGEAGLARTSETAFDVVFCDLRMPVMDGRRFRETLAVTQPALARRVVFVTGDHFGSGADAAALDAPVIEKPFRAADVLAALA
ncbi:hybrid sensor histidine kinase/response regulator [Chthonobacter rhizosphaerae]|uniref:hybrid sensor histidine kinase/response regulator n=1 Tax=Chthonobacter rhizosphaerae TaxID=2735553 RepID=UPI0015EF185D|nr:PAS domain S-box protein [Chthonobacter rhizosphaerae]